VFSVPRDSRFGHPHPVILDRYTTLGADIFRTDAHGAISCRTGGQTLWLAPYLGAPAVLSAPAPPTWRRRTCPRRPDCGSAPLQRLQRAVTRLGCGIALVILHPCLPMALVSRVL
jgi:hypothetical protein